MASIDRITVDVNLTIPDETIRKCANILKMDDNKPFADGDVVTVIDERNNYTGYHVVREIKEFENGSIGVVLERIGDLP